MLKRVENDLTARKQVEEALRRDKEFAENLLESAQVIVLVLDSIGRIVRLNPYLEKISGYRVKDVQGKDWFTTFLPEPERNSLRARFLQTLQDGQGHGSNLILTKDGQKREIEWSAKILKDAKGNAIGVLATGQDITERERAQAYLRSLIHTTQDAVISIDRQGRIDLFNPAAERVFGYTRTEVQGQKLQILMPEPYASEHDSYIAHYEQTGEPHAIGRVRTVAARRKNGEVFPIELSVTEIKAGNDIHYGAFIRDITEKIRLQEQLVERERLAAIGTTAATFAHEVGNPLNSMYMAAQLLERRLAKRHDLVDDTLTTPLRNLMSEIMRLTVLLEEFRALARRQQLRLQPISLAPLVTDLLAVEIPAYTARGIKVEQVFPLDLPTIMADGEKLKQVLLNLCKNAAEAMPHGGTLTLHAYNSGGQVRLEVSDTGIGIPTGVDIFEPFITTKAQGTGLGLTIVRQIVSAHRGTLTYHSVPGEGTTFTLMLPVRQSKD